MLYCNKCGVEISGTPDYCPLCQGELSGTPENGDAYPHIKSARDGFALALRIIGMLTIAGVLICAAVNYSVSGSLRGWWLYVAGGALSFWISFGAAVRRRGNISKSIVLTSFLVGVTAFLWDWFTGYRGWSLDYVLPIVCCAAMLAMAITARAMNLRIEQYLYYLVLNIVFGIVQLILLLCGVIGFTPLAVACVVASIISLSAILMFNGKALKAEMVRRTHL